MRLLVLATAAVLATGCTGPSHADGAAEQGGASPGGPAPAPTCSASHDALADLHVTMILFDENASAGDEVSFRTTVANGGAADAMDFAVELRVDGDVVATDTVPCLPPGHTTTLILEPPWNARAGNHTVRVDVDTTQAVDESDEANAASRTMHVD